MPKSHEGRVAIVTGAANGIGRAIALELGARGAQLVLVDLEEAADAAAQLGGRTLVLRADVSQDADWQRVAREVDSHFGRCDIVVNNAAFLKGGTIDELDYETWRRAIAVNLDSHFLSAKHFVPRMRRNHWGRFVGISSNSIGTAVQGLSHSMPSKMAIIGFIRVLPNHAPPDGTPPKPIFP